MGSTCVLRLCKIETKVKHYGIYGVKTLWDVPELNVGGGTYIFHPHHPPKKNSERPQSTIKQIVTSKPPPIKFNFKNRNF